jgi:iron complex outermembrane receptor protein
VTLQYKVVEDVMVYAGWSKGSKGGAFQGSTNSITSANFAVKPEVSNNFEVGVKSTWWNWLTVNATAYYLKFKNLQAGQYTGTPPVLITKNAAEAESKGVELVMNANLDQWIDGLSFGLTGNYIDNHYTDSPGASCTFASTLPANGGCGLNPLLAGTFTTGPNAGQLFNAKGLRFGALPAWQGTMQLNYVHPIMDGLKVELNLTADMQSSYWDDAGVMDPRYGIQNGNTKLHFRVALGDENDRWSVALIGRNVTDVLTTSAGVYAIAPARIYAIDEGRSISIQGTVKVN